MRSPRVVLAFHHHGSVVGKFAFALARAVAFEGGRIHSCIEVGSPYTDEARNKLVQRFLEGSDAEYLLMIDADIEFERDAVSKTMWVAQNFDADVVWGNYSLGTFANSIFAKDDSSDFAVERPDIVPNMVYHDVYAGGTGWCLMNRRILLRMQQECPGPWHWFDRDIVKDPNGKDCKFGEDMSFGRRVWNLKGKQIGYTGNVLIHHKLHATVPQMMQQVMTDEYGMNVIKMERSTGAEVPVVAGASDGV